MYTKIQQSSGKPFFQSCYVPHLAKRSRLLRKGLHKTYISSFCFSFSNIIATRFQNFSIILTWGPSKLKSPPVTYEYEQPHKERISFFALYWSYVFATYTVFLNGFYKRVTTTRSRQQTSYKTNYRVCRKMKAFT